MRARWVLWRPIYLPSRQAWVRRSSNFTSTTGCALTTVPGMAATLTEHVLPQDIQRCFLRPPPKSTDRTDASTTPQAAHPPLGLGFPDRFRCTVFPGSSEKI